MVAKLVIEEGDLKGLTFSFDEGESWTIGRDPEVCQLVIEDPLVSRKHCIVKRIPEEGLTIENLSHTNPLQVNDEEIGDTSYLLQNGDTIKIGNETLRFYEEIPAHAMEEDFTADDFEDLDEIEPYKPEQEEPSMTHAPLPSSAEPSAEELQPENTLFEEENPELAPLAEIDFGIVETGRWLLKVIGGPNNGAEFYMQSGHNYVLGTDPQICDIVFHDTSVSRQHAKITVTPEETLIIEDLKSRNGVLISGNVLEGQETLSPSTIVTLGTTSFVVYDREGEMQTIISPLLPSIVKVLQQEAPKEEEEAPLPSAESVEPIPTPEEMVPSKPRRLGPYIVIAAITGLFVLAGIGTSTLFKSEPIVVQTQENADELIQQSLQPFPAIRYIFNKSNGNLLLIGHVTTLAEKNQLLYNLQNLNFKKNIDDTGIVIDEYVWHEVNSILNENPAWKGITIHSPAAGQFILSGYLQTRKQADQLSSYISLNFPYLDLLKKQIIVEEDIVNQIYQWLQSKQLVDVKVSMTNGEVTLTGNIPVEGANEIPKIIDRIKQIPGARIVNNQVRTQTQETGIINITEHYPVTGKSRLGDRLTVVINGRILSEGDDLDGMDIIKITPDRVLLEKDNEKYRIDY